MKQLAHVVAFLDKTVKTKASAGIINWAYETVCRVARLPNEALTAYVGLASSCWESYLAETMVDAVAEVDNAVS